jgi:hypothetical protein
LNGTPESISAADAPIIAGMSGSISGSTGHHRRDHLHFVVEAVGKERTDRPVDQPRGQRLLLGRPASRLKKPPGILPAAYVFSW